MRVKLIATRYVFAPGCGITQRSFDDQDRPSKTPMVTMAVFKRKSSSRWRRFIHTHLFVKLKSASKTSRFYPVQVKKPYPVAARQGHPADISTRPVSIAGKRAHRPWVAEAGMARPWRTCSSSLSLNTSDGQSRSASAAGCTCRYQVRFQSRSSDLPASRHHAG